MKLSTYGLFALAFTLAGTSLIQAADPKESAPKAASSLPSLTKDWAVEISTGIEFSNLRVSNEENSSQLPVKLSAVYAIDEVSNEKLLGGLLRGYTDFIFSAYSRFVSGAGENSIYGFQAGPRYNFVQPGWKLVPYAEAEVGLGFADSDPKLPLGAKGPSGLGQDFNFTFTVGLGTKYYFTEDLYAKLALKYSHFSNSGLSEPTFQNEGTDSLGPEVSIGYRF